MWHGITWNFLVWGFWHGIGLFIQSRWSEWSKPTVDKLTGSSVWKSRVIKGAGAIVTFHFVALGWVWFALPEIRDSLLVFRTLLSF